MLVKTNIAQVVSVAILLDSSDVLYVTERGRAPVVSCQPFAEFVDLNLTPG